MLPRLHLVTDDNVLATPHFADAAAHVLARCGPDVALHVRGHGTSGARLHHVADTLAVHALRTGAWLLVNDRVDIAMAVRAQGVQLRAGSLPVADARTLLGAGAHIGCSVHDLGAAELAAAEGADFLVAGTIWATASHPDARLAGTELLADSAQRTGVPVLAIGGVTPERVRDAAAAGAYGVAVLGGVWRAPDPADAARAYVDAVRAAWNATKEA